MEKTPELIQKKLNFLPDQPGIYLWKDAAGEVIYVGKAKSLKHRTEKDRTFSCMNPALMHRSP